MAPIFHGFFWLLSFGCLQPERVMSLPSFSLQICSAHVLDRWSTFPSPYGRQLILWAILGLCANDITTRDPLPRSSNITPQLHSFVSQVLGGWLPPRHHLWGRLLMPEGSKSTPNGWFVGPVDTWLCWNGTWHGPYPRKECLRPSDAGCQRMPLLLMMSVWGYDFTPCLTSLASAQMVPHSFS